jgi:hypothetical protein
MNEGTATRTKRSGYTPVNDSQWAIHVERDWSTEVKTFGFLCTAAAISRVVSVLLLRSSYISDNSEALTCSLFLGLGLSVAPLYFTMFKETLFMFLEGLSNINKKRLVPLDLLLRAFQARSQPRQVRLVFELGPRSILVYIWHTVGRISQPGPLGRKCWMVQVGSRSFGPFLTLRTASCTHGEQILMIK